MLDGASYNPKWNGNAKKYLKAKLATLTDFCITPTSKEIEHLNTLSTQTQIDNGILEIISKHLN